MPFFKTPQTPLSVITLRSESTESVKKRTLAKLSEFNYSGVKMSERRSYAVHMNVNGRKVNEVVIDPHYETKHSDINDALILELIKYLDGKEFLHEEYDDEWEYFMLDRLEHQGKYYRLVWCMRDHCLSIGIINCFRR